MKKHQRDLLKTFSNPKKERDYLVEIKIPEFTCLCPATGQPDFALIVLIYFPNKLCIELKSLKQYITSFREVGCYHEDVSNKILDDLVSLLDPKLMQVNAEFNVRGGTYPTIRCVHKNPDWANVELRKYFNEKNYIA